MPIVRISNTLEILVPPEYIVGIYYTDKGYYLGVTKGAHKFQKHSKPHYQKQFGPKYHFEKV